MTDTNTKEFTEGVQGDVDSQPNRLNALLSRPTSEIFDEVSAVSAFAIADSKTVGGFGVNLLTVFALVIASPWSWIGMLLFGPVRVWGLFYAGVIGGIGSVLGFALIAFLVLSAVLIVAAAWAFFHVIS